MNLVGEWGKNGNTIQSIAEGISFKDLCVCSVA